MDPFQRMPDGFRDAYNEYHRIPWEEALSAPGDKFTVGLVETRMVPTKDMNVRGGTVNHILVQLRDNGRLGLPGGKLEADDEDPWAAFARECTEEHGIELEEGMACPGMALSRTTTRKGRYQSTLFVFFVSLDMTPQEIMTSSAGAADAMSEVLGVNFIPCPSSYYEDKDHKWRYQAASRLLTAVWEFPHRHILANTVFSVAHQNRARRFEFNSVRERYEAMAGRTGGRPGGHDTRGDNRPDRRPHPHTYPHPHPHRHHDVYDNQGRTPARRGIVPPMRHHPAPPRDWYPEGPPRYGDGSYHDGPPRGGYSPRDDTRYHGRISHGYARGPKRRRAASSGDGRSRYDVAEGRDGGSSKRSRHD